MRLHLHQDDPTAQEMQVHWKMEPNNLDWGGEPIAPRPQAPPSLTSTLPQEQPSNAPPPSTSFYSTPPLSPRFTYSQKVRSLWWCLMERRRRLEEDSPSPEYLDTAVPSWPRDTARGRRCRRLSGSEKPSGPPFRFWPRFGKPGF